MPLPDPNLTLIGFGAVLIAWGVTSAFLSGVVLLLWVAFKGATHDRPL